MNLANLTERDDLAGFGIGPSSNASLGNGWATARPPVSTQAVAEPEPRKCEWSGFSLEVSRGRSWYPQQLTNSQYHVLLQVVGTDASVRRVSSPPLPSELKRGELVIFDAVAGMPSRLSFAGEFVVVSLSPQFMRWAATDLVRDTGKLVLRHLETTADPVLRGLVLALWAEAESGYHGGKAYGEAMASALAAHLIRRFLLKEVEYADAEGGAGAEN